MHGTPCVALYLRRHGCSGRSGVSQWRLPFRRACTLGLQGRALMAPYLPRNGASGSPYSEGGALYALGLTYAVHGSDIQAFLLQSLRDTSNEARAPAPLVPAVPQQSRHSCPVLTLEAPPRCWRQSTTRWAPSFGEADCL